MSEHLDLTLELPPYFIDHRYMGVPVLPAVEALQALARLAVRRMEGLDVRRSCGARFKRFLQVDPDARSAEVVVELEALQSGGAAATLLTVRQAGKSGITRSVEHVAVTFGVASAQPHLTPPPPDAPPFVIPSEQLYGELVPFGPAFHNVVGEVQLWTNQASSRLRCPDLPHSDGPLGSPFPLDAALHVACAWAQRHLGAVLFPTGYDERRIIRPTEPGGRYWCDVVPLPGDSPAGARFDITLRDENGEVSEVCLGVRMDDISRGKLTPPAWMLP